MANSKEFPLPGGFVAFGTVPADPVSGLAALSFTEIDVMRGAVLGLSSLTVGAVRASLPNGVATVIEEVARTLLVSPAGVAMTAVSSSVADVGPVLRVSALGPNYSRLAPFDVTLNGTTPVALPAGPFTRINSISRVSGDLAGNVTISAAAVTYGAVALGQQSQRSSQFTVPAGHRLFIADLIGSLAKDSGSGSNVPLSLQGKPSGSTVFGGLFDWCLQRDGTSAIVLSQRYSGGLTGPFDLRIIGTASAASMDIQTHMVGLLQDLNPSA